MKRLRRPISAAEATEDTRLDDAMDGLKDDFDYILSGLEKLGRSGAAEMNDGLVIAEKLSDTFQTVIAQIADNM